MYQKGTAPPQTPRDRAEAPTALPDAAFRKLIHDMRSPLTTLQLGIETLRDSTPDQDMAGFLDQMLTEVARLTRYLEVASSARRSRPE